MSEVVGHVQFTRTGFETVNIRLTFDARDFQKEARVFGAFLAMVRDARLNDKIFFSIEDFVSKYLGDFSHTYDEADSETKDVMVRNFITHLSVCLPPINVREVEKELIDVIYEYDFTYLEPFAVEVNGYKSLFSIMNHLCIHEADFVRLLEDTDLLNM